MGGCGRASDAEQGQVWAGGAGVTGIWAEPRSTWDTGMGDAKSGSRGETRPCTSKPWRRHRGSLQASVSILLHEGFLVFVQHGARLEEQDLMEKVY